ncbi:hypothetical protein BDA96_02G171700 [Sorghum bicolor]|uniref:Uncharacterized protein n=1 Tax=Sorghum bicolor TaxID=4558 RepID=A0A921UVP1_SORBI|nr:hypothetical protein BDA96_02G171700 [Sorghum bicolor]
MRHMIQKTGITIFLCSLTLLREHSVIIANSKTNINLTETSVARPRRAARLRASRVRGERPASACVRAGPRLRASRVRGERPVSGRDRASARRASSAASGRSPRASGRDRASARRASSAVSTRPRRAAGKVVARPRLRASRVRGERPASARVRTSPRVYCTGSPRVLRGEWPVSGRSSCNSWSGPVSSAVSSPRNVQQCLDTGGRQGATSDADPFSKQRTRAGGGRCSGTE